MNSQPFLAFLAERHAIFVRRARGNARPWTDNRILNAHKFCNVFRELDRGTVWLNKNWYAPHYNDPDVWLAACFARRSVTNTDALEQIGYPLPWKQTPIRRRMIHRSEKSDPLMHTGYRIITGGKGHDETPIDFLVRMTQSQYERRRDWPAINSVQFVAEWFAEAAGFGPFISGQIALDLLMTGLLANATDRADWAAVGPGSKRGLNRLNSNPLEAAVSQEQGVKEMRLIAGMARANGWPKEYPTLRVCDIEHGLCEYDKYLRIQQGEKRCPIFRPMSSSVDMTSLPSLKSVKR